MAEPAPSPESITHFDPVIFSDEENLFIQKHVGKSPAAAFTGAKYGPGFSRIGVEAFLSRIRDLKDVQELHKLPWVGEEPIVERSNMWMEYRERYKAAKALNPSSAHPSMFHFTADGSEYYQGVGSDSGLVRTYFDEDGTRRPWALPLTKAHDAQSQAAWGSQEIVESMQDDRLAVNEDLTLGKVECSICGHTETWDPDKPTGRGPARRKMKKHCMSARKDVAMHRKLGVEVFGR
jgi:hypothetical protein